MTQLKKLVSDALRSERGLIQANNGFIDVVNFFLGGKIYSKLWLQCNIENVKDTLRFTFIFRRPVHLDVQPSRSVFSSKFRFCLLRLLLQKFIWKSYESLLSHLTYGITSRLD